jgi:subtilisin family serine protease
MWGRTHAPDGWYLADSPAVNYRNNTNSWAQYASPMSLAGLKDCRFRYTLYTELEDGFDFLYSEVSTDQTHWTAVGTYTGDNDGFFIQTNEYLTAFEGAPQIYVRFRLKSDAIVTRDGAYIDEIRLRCFPATPVYDGDEYWFDDGTSMATPHVAGVAALLLAKNPAATVAMLRSAILSSVDLKPSLAGKTVTGGRLNAMKALAALPPTCGSTVTVTAKDFSFSPNPRGAAQGQCVQWNFTGPSAHSATDTRLLGPSSSPLFDSGVRAAGSNYAFAFTAAGKYPYASTAPGDPGSMTGTVKVPLKSSANGGGSSTPITITWASSLAAGYRSDIQYRYKACDACAYGTWKNWKVDQTVTSGTFLASSLLGPGIYQLRARLENGGTVKSSLWSASKTLTIT